MRINRKISFVIPAYNEVSNVEKLYEELTEVMARTQYHFEFIFVDDGSTDGTLKVIKKLSEKDSRIFYVELSRNFGHQNALKAGFDMANGDCVISMDCDMQHPPAIVAEMLSRWEEGYDVVYHQKEGRLEIVMVQTQNVFIFYSLHNWLSDFKLEEGTADFRLMTRNFLNAFSHLQENELFIRGLVKWAGFRQIAIEYNPNERFSGETKYSTSQMMSFAFRAITSFSEKPLKLFAYVGLILFMISVILVPYALVSYFLGVAESGWTSLMITIIIFGSLQLLMLGVIGLYISKLVIQSKQRPLYFIRETNYEARPQGNR